MRKQKSVLFSRLFWIRANVFLTPVLFSIVAAEGLIAHEKVLFELNRAGLEAPVAQGHGETGHEISLQELNRAGGMAVTEPGERRDSGVPSISRKQQEDGAVRQETPA